MEFLVNLCMKIGRGALRIPGLAYVAFARVWSFDGFARRGLTSLSKFLQCRGHLCHIHRFEYETRLGELHEEFMRPQGISPNEGIELHKDQIKEQEMKNLGMGRQSAR